jgi:hypothetical protein
MFKWIKKHIVAAIIIEWILALAILSGGLFSACIPTTTPVGISYGATGRTASYVIAAWNAPAVVKAQSDYAMPTQYADTGAIISAAIAAGYHSISETEGTFYWTTNVACANNVTFTGQGQSTINIQTTGINLSSFFYGNSLSGCTFSNFVIDGNRSNQSTGQTALNFNSHNQLLINNVTIKNYLGTAIVDTSCNNVTVSNCTFSNNIQDVSVYQAAGRSNTIQILNNNCSAETGGSAYTAIGITECDGVVIQGNTLSGYNVDIGESTLLTYTGNICNGAGANLYGEGISGLCTISDNVFNNVNGAINIVYTDSNFPDKIVMVGNEIYGGNSFGVNLNPYTSIPIVAFTGNIISGVGTNGLQSGHLQGVISGNTFANNGQNTNNTYSHISFTDWAWANISGNYFYGTGITKVAYSIKTTNEAGQPCLITSNYFNGEASGNITGFSVSTITNNLGS